MANNPKTALWDLVKTTDPKYTKSATIGGHRITAIDAAYQRRLATEQFGPCGIGWGIDNSKFDYMSFDNGSRLATYSADFWFILDGVRGTFPIASNILVCYITQSGKGYLKVDDEYAKKAQTNALTKGLSFLGFNADVFLGLFDDHKYVQEQIEAHAEPEPEPEPPKPQTASEKAESLALLKVDIKWIDLIWPWAKPEAVAGQTLADLAANAEVAPLTSMRDHFQKLVTPETPSLGKYVAKIDLAIGQAIDSADFTAPTPTATTTTEKL